MATYERWQMVKYYDEPGGFIYQTGAGQRFLKSNKSGFALQDSAKPVANCGNIDWTDGKNLISWQGMHRYSASLGGDTVIYRNNKTFDFSGLIGGYVLGAAYKNGVFIIFTFNNVKSVNYFFVSGGDILESGYIGSYEKVIQIVAISPDCTKGAFIAIPTGQTDKQTVIIDLSIDIENMTVSIVNEQLQDFYIDDSVFTSGVNISTYHYIRYGVNGGSVEGDAIVTDINYSSSSNVIVAVDYDASNTRKTFFIASSFSASTQIDYGYYISAGGIAFDATVGFNNATATINYNDIITTAINVELASGGEPDFVQSGNKSFSFLVINDLDLRYGLFAYTNNAETEDVTDPYFTLNRDYVLELETFLCDFKAPLIYTGTTLDDVFFMNTELFYKNVIGAGVVFLVNPIWSIFNLKPTLNTIEHGLASASLTDRHANKLRGYNTINRVSGSTLFFDEPIVYLKIDKNNTVFTNTITALTGVI